MGGVGGVGEQTYREYSELSSKRTGRERGGREREEERNTSSCTAMAKTSTGKDKEVPPVETKNGEMRKIIKTSGEKGVADLSSFL